MDVAASLGALGAEPRERLRQPVDRAADRRRVAFLLDLRAEQLDFEQSLVARVEQLAEHPFERDVAVAERAAVHAVRLADLVVAELHENEAIDVVAEQPREVALD